MRPSNAPSTRASTAPARMAIAVVIPCLNEAQSIARVVSDFRKALPEARIYVYDNGSSDETVNEAVRSGAIVRIERMRGKGNVVRRMFADVDADLYFLVDGDATYNADAAPKMIEKMTTENLDMVVARRLAVSAESFPAGHRFGNRVISGAIHYVFGRGVTDVLSGFRLFSRRFIKSFPAMSSGFDVETEMTVHALELRLAIGQIDTAYRARQPGSTSKLKTVRDGILIARIIFNLIRYVKPIPFFFSSALLLFILSIFLAAPIVITFMETGLVPRFPTAILATGMTVVAVVSIACGLILDSVNRGRVEMKRLHFLSHPSVPAGDSRDA